MSKARDTSADWFEDHDLLEWSGHLDPNDPDNYWIDDNTGERINVHTGEREMKYS